MGNAAEDPVVPAPEKMTNNDTISATDEILRWLDKANWVTIGSGPTVWNDQVARIVLSPLLTMLGIYEQVARREMHASICRIPPDMAIGREDGDATVIPILSPESFAYAFPSATSGRKWYAIEAHTIFKIPRGCTVIFRSAAAGLVIIHNIPKHDAIQSAS